MTYTNPLRIIWLLVILSCSEFSYLCAAEYVERAVGRLNMGFYFNSISEIANRTDVEVSMNFLARDLLAAEANKHDFSITSSQAILYDNIFDMKKAFENGDLDIIVAPPLLVSKYFNREELANGFAGVHEGKKFTN